MKYLLIGMTLFALTTGANAAELMDKTEMEFQGRELLVYQGHCAQDNFTIQKVSRGYQYIGPNGFGMALTPKNAAEQACGVQELEC
jgi:hypothetical protein